MSVVTEYKLGPDDVAFDALMRDKGLYEGSPKLRAAAETPDTPGFESKDAARLKQTLAVQERSAESEAARTHRGQKYALYTWYIRHVVGVGNRAEELAGVVADMTNMKSLGAIWFKSLCKQIGFGHDRPEETYPGGKTKERHGDVPTPDQVDCVTMFVEEGQHLVVVVAIAALTTLPDQDRAEFMNQVTSRQRLLVCMSYRDTLLARWLVRNLTTEELESIRRFSDLAVIPVKTEDLRDNADPAKRQLVAEQDRAQIVIEVLNDEFAKGKKFRLAVGDNPKLQIRPKEVEATAAGMHRERLLRSGVDKYPVYFKALARFAEKILGQPWTPLLELGHRFGLESRHGRESAIAHSRLFAPEFGSRGVPESELTGEGFVGHPGMGAIPTMSL